MVLSATGFLLKQSEMQKQKMKSSLRLQVGEGILKAKALRKYQKVSTKNDEVASRSSQVQVQSDQIKRSSSVKAQMIKWLLGPHVQTSGPPQIIQLGTLEHRYKKLHQSNELDCFVTHKLFSFILKHYSFSLF